ncbi:MAG TPA: hypothetical protein VIQ31_28375 [Phormidium sp.]
MGKKKNPLIPQTSLKGKKLRTSENIDEKKMKPILPNKPLSVNLQPSNIGTVQKTTKTLKNTTVRNKTALPNAIDNTNKTFLPNAFKTHNSTNLTVKFVSKPNKNNFITAKQIPLIVKSQDNEAKQNESNTVSDLSTQQSFTSSNIGLGFVSTAACQGSTAHQRSEGPWPTLEERVFLEKEATVSQIERYVKKDFFHKLKFISCPTMMSFSWDPRSLSQVACNYFNVSKSYQHQFWAHYGRYFPRFLNKKRADVSNAMKYSFRGKYKIYVNSCVDSSYPYIRIV